jgi:YidC/Oxa1 family membrane protein insertase
MEKRLVAAIVLSFLVLIGYQLLFKPKPQQPVQPETTATAPPPPLKSTPAVPALQPAPEAKPETPPAQPQEIEPTGAQAEETVVIDTPLYRAEWSNRGAVLKSWKLKNYLDAEKHELDLVSARSVDTGQYPFALRTEDPAVATLLNGALYEVGSTEVTVKDGATESVRFAYSDGKTLQAEKTLRFIGGTYQVEIETRIVRNGQEIMPYVVWGPGIGNPSPAELKQKFSARMGAAVFTGGKVYRIDEAKYKPDQSAFNFVDWAAYEDNYFAALFVPPPQKGQAVFLQQTEGQQQEYFLAVSQPQQAFIGPKSFDALRAFGHETRKVINFGMFGSIAELLLIAVKFFYGLVPNWGVAIIILTIVIKIIFFPLTYSSTKSMAKMAELQPKIKALRSKYKKAKTDIAQRRQMNEEMMKLYKEHGVNPAGGCLPMLIQLPVFWGVFRMLVVSVEFRHAPFFLWITDLSVRDPYYVTPILMGVTQFISQKMTPTSADPSQARMMLIMPVIMTVFFMNFQSGLVLYWLTTNVLQIGQQALMNRMMARHKRESDGKRKKDR